MRRLLVDAVATYRLTRLATSDTIAEPARHAIAYRAYERHGRVLGAGGPLGLTVAEAIADDHDQGLPVPKLAELVVCPWCAGMWVAAGVIVARRVAPRAWAPIAELLVCAAAAGWLAAHDT